jgi:hypothetical protein
MQGVLDLSVQHPHSSDIRPDPTTPPDLPPAGQGRRIRIFITTHLTVAALALGVAYTLGSEAAVDPVPVAAAAAAVDQPPDAAASAADPYRRARDEAAAEPSTAEAWLALNVQGPPRRPGPLPGD